MGAGTGLKGNVSPTPHASPVEDVDPEILENLEMIDDMEVVALPQHEWEMMGEVPERLFHDPKNFQKSVDEGEKK